MGFMFPDLNGLHIIKKTPERTWDMLAFQNPSSAQQHMHLSDSLRFAIAVSQHVSLKPCISTRETQGQIKGVGDCISVSCSRKVNEASLCLSFTQINEIVSLVNEEEAVVDVPNRKPENLQEV